MIGFVFATGILWFILALSVRLDAEALFGHIPAGATFKPYTTQEPVDDLPIPDPLLEKFQELEREIAARPASN